MDINLLNKIQEQIDECYQKYGSYRSQHEFLGVLDEEIFELKQCIYEKNLDKKHTEQEIIDCIVVLMKGFQDIIKNNNIL